MSTYYVFQKRNQLLGTKQFFWRSAKETFDIHDYMLSYIGSIETDECNSMDEILEKIFKSFQESPPDHGVNMVTNFYSMSSTDVIMIDNHYYWCDPFGWIEITNEWNKCIWEGWSK